MKGWFLLLLPCVSAFLWHEGDLVLDLNQTQSVLGFEPTPLVSTVCLQQQAIRTSPSVFSLHATSDLWAHFPSIVLTHSSLTLSSTAPTCTRNDTSWDVSTQDVVVTQYHQCATPRYRWKGTLCVLFVTTIAYLYLTTHQPYGQHAPHPKWSPWWSLLSITLLFPLQPIETATLLVAWSSNNRFLLMILLEGIVALLHHAYDPIFSTVLVYAYLLYVTTSRLVQISFRSHYDAQSLYVWIRSLVLFGRAALWWTNHVLTDPYGVPALPITVLLSLLVGSVALTRRCHWVLMSYVFSLRR